MSAQRTPDRRPASGPPTRPDRTPALATAAEAHHRAQAERRRHERWRDLLAVLSVLATALLVVHGLPPG